MASKRNGTGTSAEAKKVEEPAATTVPGIWTITPLPDGSRKVDYADPIRGHRHCGVLGPEYSAAELWDWLYTSADDFDLVVCEGQVHQVLKRGPKPRA